MPAKTEGVLGLSYGWALGEDAWNTGMDTNIHTLATLSQLNVITKTLSTNDIPTTTNGNVYIASDTGSIVYILENSKLILVPKEGWKAVVKDENDSEYIFNGTDWVEYLDFGLLSSLVS